MKIWQYIAVSMVFLLGLMSLYASYAIFSIQLHLVFVPTGIIFMFFFLAAAIVLFRLGFRLYK